MGYFIAMIIGYLIGARAGSKDLDQLSESVKALRASEEFGDVVAAARSHVGHTLRELASALDGSSATAADPEAEPQGDLVDRVRHIFGQPSQQ
jgi:hypothetical protein